MNRTNIPDRPKSYNVTPSAQACAFVVCCMKEMLRNSADNTPTFTLHVKHYFACNNE